MSQNDISTSSSCRTLVVAEAAAVEARGAARAAVRRRPRQHRLRSIRIPRPERSHLRCRRSSSAKRAMNKRILIGIAVIAAVMVMPLSGTRSTFVPDWTFKGTTLAGWEVLGQADWRASDGELIGTPKTPEGGWLVLDNSFQDVQFGADFRCTGGCKTGV